ncbi:hypothetical protein [Nitrosopumilus sp.]|uniref:hypothetical protein n=1 Tax=Nitrosopumilus sp. TaxID=2024843 RepID=UPI00247C2268|nr:hypothetical protein [Nitrosopumilus sp.]MCV0431370.1 hypothetical protein [Nitrosopumilus sp.]
MTSAEDISKMFYSESEKLVSLFDTADSKTDVNIHEIVETYYQVMNVSSMASMLKQQATESEELTKTIQQTEKLISSRFDSTIHPKIMEKLSLSIQELTKTLQSGSGEKSKEQTESDAKLFEELRQNMSTREFVQQYENGLSHD